MAKGFKSGGRDYKPGESGNPAGKPAMPPEQKAFRNLTVKTFLELAQKYQHASREELKRVAEDQSTPAIELILVSWIRQAFQDHKAAEAYLSRLIGKVPDKVEMQGTLSQAIYKAPDGNMTAFNIDSEEG